MSKRSKPTRYERVRIDFSIEFKEPHDSTVLGGPEDFAMLRMAILSALSGVAETKGIDGLCGGTSMSFGLDKRKRDADGRLLK